MTRRDLSVFYLLALLLLTGVAALTPTAAYMDAAYYTLTGIRLAQGEGFTENFIWNYLDEPSGLPRPSHTFWMPLSSILAAAGMWLAGSASYGAARGAFLLMAAAIPPLTAALSFRFHQSRSQAWLAGLFALFPGFYFVFLPAVDGFTPYMFFGGLLALLLPGLLTAAPPRAYLLAAIAGLLVGLMQLTRSDGILWAVVLAAMLGLKGRSFGRRASIPLLIGLVACGYLLVMTPWYARNLHEYQALTPPGVGRVLWLTDYDELYSYPASKLTFNHWWHSGLGEILRLRLWALGQNLQTLLAVQGAVMLLPFMLGGLWKLRAHPAVQYMAAVWLLTLLLMTLVFPLPGVRGSFFHASAGFQPLLWAAAPVGLGAFVQWGARVRGWQAAQAGKVFSVGLVCLAIGFTSLVSLPKLTGVAGEQPARDRAQRFARAEALLQEAGVQPGALILVNSPPWYTLATGRETLAIPHGGLEDVFAAARDYGAAAMVLEPNTNLPALYANPELDERFQLIGVVEGVQVYCIHAHAQGGGLR